jgi:predicted TIM-barrel fold metal-dependent hydrolase
VLIADSQVHIWGPDRPDRPWLKGHAPRRPVPLGPEELLREMDAAAVQRAVLVPPRLEGDRNEFVLEAAQKYPDRFAVMGRIPLEAPGARERNFLRKWRQQPGMLGIRCSFAAARWTDALDRGDLDWLWHEAEAAGVPVMALVTQELVPLIDRIAERHCGLKLAICHLALPTDQQDEEAFRNFDKVLVLARRANVVVKASALPAYTTDGYPFRAVHPYLRRVYDAFGPRRMFWGSDFSRLRCSYREAVTMFTEEIPWLTSGDKEWIMGRSLCEWLGWNLPDAGGQQR